MDFFRWEKISLICITGVHVRPMGNWSRPRTCSFHISSHVLLHVKTCFLLNREGWFDATKPSEGHGNIPNAYIVQEFFLLNKISGFLGEIPIDNQKLGSWTFVMMDSFRSFPLSPFCIVLNGNSSCQHLQRRIVKSYLRFDRIYTSKPNWRVYCSRWRRLK